MAVDMSWSAASRASVDSAHWAKTQLLLQARSRTAPPASDESDSVDTEFEDSDRENDSSRSLHSRDSRRRSITTVSSYDDVPTPGSTRSTASGRARRPFDIQIKAIEGPRGPHLFRPSQLGSDFDYALQLSPALPKDPPRRTGTSFSEETITPTTRQRQKDFSIAAALAAPELSLDNAEQRIREWRPSQVTDWMQTCGIDASIIDTFELNDINGAVLLDLQFDHLRDQLDIQSFGKRHQLWSAICSLRGEDIIHSRHATPFQDISRPCTTSTHRTVGHEGATDMASTVTKKRRGRKPSKGGDIVAPSESISIVAIEQLIPKPHKCNKGERCAKWRKQQREIKQLQEENGIGRFPISPTRGGRILISGDPGNAATAEKILPKVRKQTEEQPGQGTDTMPSLVASSDALGPGHLPEFALHQTMLNHLGNRDPQDNVRQFLNLQHVQVNSESTEPPQEQWNGQDEIPRSTSVPPMFPSNHHPAYPSMRPSRGSKTPGPRDSLKMLPKLEIPTSLSPAPDMHANVSANPATSPCRSANATPAMVYRLPTPQSEMDVPVTMVPKGPVARNASQSVPPNMQYRPQAYPSQPLSTQRSIAELQRPSTTLPAVMENEVLLSPIKKSHTSPTTSREMDQVLRRPSTKLQRSSSFHDPARDTSAVKQFGYGENCTHAGYMKKRKTRLLRHEWQEAHFRLQGSELSMHEDARIATAAKERINVDNYGVTCSANVSSSKLSAAMKAFRIRNEASGAAKADNAAFNFQLVPNKDGDRKLAASGKTHHFAVKTADDRIDWMRELMLHKALKQKGQGYNIELNGEPF